MRGMELALGNLQDKVVLLRSTLREDEEEDEQDITKRKQLWSRSSFISGKIGKQTNKKNKGLVVRY